MREGIVRMNVNEIQKKIKAYMLSDAPTEVKDREISKLRNILDSIVVNGDTDDMKGLLQWK